VRALILGTGDAFTRTGFGSCALLEGPGGYVLIDCVDPIHRVLAEASARAGWKVAADGIDDVLLTHLHGDHCNGLESFGFARRILRDEREAPIPRVYLNRQAAPRLWPRLAPAMEVQRWFGRPARLDDYFELQPIEPGSSVEVAGLRVECRMTAHTVPTSGFRIHGEGFSLGWSGDTTFDPEHLEWLLEADLVVHEAGFPPAHTPIEKLRELPADVRRRLRLIHLPEGFDAAGCGIERLYAGDVLGG
jgi:ribonuclease BN (tRNA processing enzyme)